MKLFIIPTIFISIVTLSVPLYCYAQTSGSIHVGGDIDKFYPVTWVDGNWASGVPTELSISRVSVHDNSTWRGSLMSSFTYHVTAWGHGSSFIDAKIHHNIIPFIAGWRDATIQ